MIATPLRSKSVWSRRSSRAASLVVEGVGQLVIRLPGDDLGHAVADLDAQAGHRLVDGPPTADIARRPPLSDRPRASSSAERHDVGRARDDPVVGGAGPAQDEDPIGARPGQGRAGRSASGDSMSTDIAEVPATNPADSMRSVTPKLTLRLLWSSSARPTTKVPAPWRRESRPSCSRIDTAWRTVALLTPSCWASIGSAGRRPSG